MSAVRTFIIPLVCYLVHVVTMPSTAAKPLPELPQSDLTLKGSQKGDLPLNARDHVRKVVAQCLADESLPTSWISPVHQVVQDISKAICAHDWLPGIQATRDFRRRHTLEAHATHGNAAATHEPQETRDADKDTLRPNKYLAPSKAAVASAGSSSPSPRRFRAPKLRGPELQEVNARAMGELQRLSNKSNVMDLSCNPPLGSMLHLVITLVLPEADPFFSLPDNPRCYFARGEFALPEVEDKNAKHGTVIDLSGVEGWKCEV